MSASAPVLRMAGVTRVFPSAHGDVPVLTGVDLRVEAGEFLMITGPSGSGKTTLLNLAALLDFPSAGVIEFEGEDTARWTDGRRTMMRGQGVGMVFQKFCLLPHRSALDNVRFRFRYAAEPGGGDEAARAMAALDEMGLAGIADRPARLLSAGEMQRVALARAVVRPPRLLVADEPTGNLDAASARAVMTCLSTLHARGLTILMVTHHSGLLGAASRHLRCEGGGVAAPDAVVEARGEAIA